MSHGFRFDNFTGAVTVGIPIVVSWHRDVNDTGQIDFEVSPYPKLQGHQSDVFLGSVSTSNVTQPNGTLALNFLILGCVFSILQ